MKISRRRLLAVIGAVTTGLVPVQALASAFRFHGESRQCAVLGLGSCGYNVVHQELQGKEFQGGQSALTIWTKGGMRRHSEPKDMIHAITESNGIIVVCGLGGMMSYRVVPCLLRNASRVGKAVGVVCTLPFSFEVSRKGTAIRALYEIRAYTDQIYVLEQDRLARMLQNYSLMEYFKMANRCLANETVRMCRALA